MKWIMGINVIGMIVSTLLVAFFMSSGKWVLIMLLYCIGGFFINPLFAYLIDMSVEIAFPIGEGTAAGFM